MNNGKTIFSQIMSLIQERDFNTCVNRYKGNYRARNFSCRDQFLVMSYAQLTNRGSLRDIENCLTALSTHLIIAVLVTLFHVIPWQKQMKPAIGESIQIMPRLSLRECDLFMLMIHSDWIWIIWCMLLTVVQSVYV